MSDLAWGPGNPVWEDLKDEQKMKVLKEVLDLVKDGILGSELCPEPDYWHWPVLKPDLLSGFLRENYKKYGEIRW